MLELKNISKTFNKGTINAKLALDNLSLTLNDGDFVTVIGGNGAGKSTMLNAIAGVFFVDEGTIKADDVDLTNMPDYKRATMLGRVFQDPMKGTNPNMMIEENMALALRRGQRRGLNIGGTEDRIFVVKKDLDKNILYIAIGDENKYLFSNTAVIEDFNFLTDERPSKCTCKFRYRQPDINTEVEYLDNNMLRLNYVKSKAVTPGQFCVLYDGDICLGGGIIKEVK